MGGQPLDFDRDLFVRQMLALRMLFGQLALRWDRCVQHARRNRAARRAPTTANPQVEADEDDETLPDLVSDSDDEEDETPTRGRLHPHTAAVWGLSRGDGRHGRGAAG